MEYKDIKNDVLVEVKNNVSFYESTTPLHFSSCIQDNSIIL
jgi:hypothetical protein